MMCSLLRLIEFRDSPGKPYKGEMRYMQTQTGKRFRQEKTPGAWREGFMVVDGTGSEKFFLSLMRLSRS
jgi:hypothetical protein